MKETMELSQKYTVEVDKITKKEWEAILPEFDDATIYQTWSYGAVRWGEENLSHLVLKCNDEIVGLAQATIKKIPGIKAGIAYVPWGPLWMKKGSAVENEKFKKILSALKEEYAHQRGLLLRVFPNVYDFQGNIFPEIMQSEKFIRNEDLPNYRTLLVDITPSMDELRRKLNPKWRNKLSGAEKNNLKLVVGTSDDLYQIFQNLQKEMEDRKEYIPGVNYDEFGLIQKDLPEHLKMKIAICENEGESIACTIVTAIGSAGIYILGATGNKGLNMKGSYLLHWRLIDWLKDKGCKYYDLGGINPDKNPGVYNFKAGMNGMDVSHIGQYEYSESSISKIVVLLGEKFRH